MFPCPTIPGLNRVKYISIAIIRRNDLCEFIIVKVCFLNVAMCNHALLIKHQFLLMSFISIVFRLLLLLRLLTIVFKEVTRANTTCPPNFILFMPCVSQTSESIVVFNFLIISLGVAAAALFLFSFDKYNNIRINDLLSLCGNLTFINKLLLYF